MSLDPWKRGNATHEIYFSIETRPMDILTVNVKKTAASSIQAATSDIKDDNSITNGAITLTFGRMGVETFNIGQKSFTTL